MEIKKLRPLDFIIILLFLFIIVLSIIFLKSNKSGTPQLIIENSIDKWIYNMDSNRIIEISGIEGISEIHIHEGKAYFHKSPCSNKTCIATGSIQLPGEWAACLPNRVFIRIENSANFETSTTTEFETDIIAQ